MVELTKAPLVTPQPGRSANLDPPVGPLESSRHTVPGSANKMRENVCLTKRNNASHFNFTCILYTEVCFLKWMVPQIIQTLTILVLKPTVLRCPHLWKHLHIGMDKLQATNLQHWPSLAPNPSWEQASERMSQVLNCKTISVRQRTITFSQGKMQACMHNKQFVIHICIHYLYIFLLRIYIYIYTDCDEHPPNCKSTPTPPYFAKYSQKAPNQSNSSPGFSR